MQGSWQKRRWLNQQWHTHFAQLHCSQPSSQKSQLRRLQAWGWLVEPEVCHLAPLNSFLWLFLFAADSRGLMRLSGTESASLVDSFGGFSSFPRAEFSTTGVYPFRVGTRKPEFAGKPNDGSGCDLGCPAGDQPPAKASSKVASNQVTSSHYTTTSRDRKLPRATRQGQAKHHCAYPQQACLSFSVL